MIQYLITTIIDLVIAYLAVSKRQDGVSISLSLLAVATALWTFELYFLTLNISFEIIDQYFAVFRSGLFLVPGCLSLFVWFLLKKQPNLFVPLVLIPGVAFGVILSLLNNTVFPSTLKIAENGYIPEVDSIYIFFVALFVWCVLGSVVSCLLVYGKSPHREKRRIKWVLVTLLTGFVFGLSAMYLFKFSNYLSNLSGPLTNVIFFLPILYATLKHDLVDVRQALSIVVSRVLLLTIFCWLYFTIPRYLDLGEGSIGGAITLIAFVFISLELYPMLIKWIGPGANSIFNRGKYDLYEYIFNLKDCLDRSTSLSDVNASVKSYVDKIFPSSKMELIATRKNSNVNKSNSIIDRALENIVDHRQSLPVNERVLIVEHEIDNLFKAALEKEFRGIIILLTNRTDRIGILTISIAKDKKLPGYNDVKFCEWLSKELPQVLIRVASIEKFESELSEAKKKLSLINIINHYNHDIKAPLSVIDGVVTHELYDKEKQRQIILEQVALGSRLISTMANLLRGNRQRTETTVSVGQIIDDCLLIFGHSLKESQVNIAEDISVFGDADDLKILFINLIKNATEAARDNHKISLEIKAWREPQSINVSVIDNGQGIAESKLREIWNLEGSEKPRGNGVGLQAVKRIAEEHNAVISVMSKQGEGTNVTLTFPLAAA